MNRIAVFAVGVLLFGAGFFSGRYGNVGTAPQESLPIEASSDVRPSGVAPASVRPSSSSAPPRLVARPIVSPASRNKSSIGLDSVGVLPPASARPGLTLEEQAELLLQQQEATRASAMQVEAMIVSLEEGGAPEEQIAHFRELKKAMEAETVNEADVLDTDPPERTEEELFDEFATSLEQSGIPLAESEQLLDAYAHSLEPATIDSGGADTHSEPSSLPHNGLPPGEEQ